MSSRDCQFNDVVRADPSLRSVSDRRRSAGKSFAIIAEVYRGSLVVSDSVDVPQRGSFARTSRSPNIRRPEITSEDARRLQYLRSRRRRAALHAARGRRPRATPRRALSSTSTKGTDLVCTPIGTPNQSRRRRALSPIRDRWLRGGITIAVDYGGGY